MPTEFRHIIFTREELLAAIKGYRKRRRDPLPAGSIISFSLEKDPYLHVVLRVAPDSGEGPVRFTVERDELANALIMYCIDYRIPMPVESTKFLQIFGGSVGLVITKNVASAEIDSVAE